MSGEESQKCQRVMDGCDARGTTGNVSSPRAWVTQGRDNEGEEAADKWIKRICSSCTRMRGKLFGVTREKARRIGLVFAAGVVGR